MRRNRLHTMLCVTNEHSPTNERFTTVKITDGKRTQYTSFGRHVSRKQIMYMVPYIFMDSLVTNGRKTASR